MSWNTELLKQFRGPGDFRYQLISGEEVPLLTEGDPQETEWIYYASPMIELSLTSIFERKLLNKVQNGAWVLDGTVEPIFKDNKYTMNGSRVARKYGLPAKWVIVSDDPEKPNMSDLPNENQTLAIVWDAILQAFPTTFKVQGATYLSDTEFNVVWEINVSDNNKVTSIVDVSKYSNTEYNMICVEASDWSNSGKSDPTLCGFYLGYSEDSVVQDNKVLSVKYNTSVDLYSNSLATQDLSVEVSNLPYIRSVDKDLLLETKLPGNARMFAQFGQTFADGNMYYIEPVTFFVSEYSAPTDSQTIKITSVDALSRETEVFKFFYTVAYADWNAGIKLDEPLEILMNRLQISAKANIIEDLPPEIYDERYSTRSPGCLPKNVTVNQALQYIAQLIGYICVGDTTGKIKFQKIADLSTITDAQLNQENLTSWPAITVDTAFNKIEITKYNEGVDLLTLYGSVAKASFKLNPGSLTDPSKQWQRVSVYWSDPIEVTSITSMSITGTTDDNIDVNPEYRNLKMRKDGATFEVKWIMPDVGANCTAEVHSYPGRVAFQTFSITNDTLDPITLRAAWDKPKRGVYFEYDWDDFEPIPGTQHLGTYNAEVTLVPKKIHTSGVTVQLFGGDTKPTSEIIVFWDESDKYSGETLKINNPLISTDFLVEQVGTYVKSLILNRKRYQLKYTGNPQIKSLNMLNASIGYEDVSDMIITFSKIEFNGGYSGTIEGRTL